MPSYEPAQAFAPAPVGTAPMVVTEGTGFSTGNALAIHVSAQRHSPAFVDDAAGEVDAVELGKKLAVNIIPELESETEPKLAHDSSTNALIRWYREHRG